MTDIKRVGVLGCGLMGGGIAQVAATAGYDTVVRDVSQQVWDKARAGIEKSLGKLVEKGKLPAPDRDSGQTYIAPRNEIEERLAAIWAEVLGLERVGVEDNFFALGGHSLLATQVISRAQDAFRKNLPVRRLFENPTISGLARLIENLSEPQIADGAQAPVLPVIRRLNRAGGAGL